jgi:hypothetical protein
MLVGLPGVGLTEFRATIKRENGEVTEFATVLHEDNNDGCMRLANMDQGRMTARSKPC